MLNFKLKNNISNFKPYVIKLISKLKRDKIIHFVKQNIYLTKKRNL